MKKFTGIFLQNRLVFKAETPGDGGRRTEAEKATPRERTEVVDRREVLKKFEDRRGRLALLHSKKTLDEKYAHTNNKNLHVKNVLMTAGIRGESVRVDKADALTVLKDGQMYEIEGEKYVLVELTRATGGFKGKKYKAYVRVEDSEENEVLDFADGGLDLRRTAKESGRDVLMVKESLMVGEYLAELNKYLDKKALHARFDVQIVNKAATGGHREVHVYDLHRNNHLVSLMRTDVGPDANGGLPSEPLCLMRKAFTDGGIEPKDLQENDFMNPKKVKDAVRFAELEIEDYLNSYPGKDYPELVRPPEGEKGSRPVKGSEPEKKPSKAKEKTGVEKVKEGSKKLYDKYVTEVEKHLKQLGLSNKLFFRHQDEKDGSVVLRLVTTDGGVVSMMKMPNLAVKRGGYVDTSKPFLIPDGNCPGNDEVYLAGGSPSDHELKAADFAEVVKDAKKRIDQYGGQKLIVTPR